MRVMIMASILKTATDSAIRTGTPPATASNARRSSTAQADIKAATVSGQHVRKRSEEYQSYKKSTKFSNLTDELALKNDKVSMVAGSKITSTLNFDNLKSLTEEEEKSTQLKLQNIVISSGKKDGQKPVEGPKGAEHDEKGQETSKAKRGHRRVDGYVTYSGKPVSSRGRV